MPKKLKTWQKIRDDRAYLDAALHLAVYETQMQDSFVRSCYASIPGFDGLWVTAPTVEDAARELRAALRGWIYVHVRHGHNPLPLLPPCPHCQEEAEI